MGIGKIARGLGKVGLLIEGLGYVVSAGKALIVAVKRRPSEEQADNSAQSREDQQSEQDAIDRR